jgi:hypothetical protein
MIYSLRKGHNSKTAQPADEPGVASALARLQRFPRYVKNTQLGAGYRQNRSAFQTPAISRDHSSRPRTRALYPWPAFFSDDRCCLFTAALALGIVSLGIGQAVLRNIAEAQCLHKGMC